MGTAVDIVGSNGQNARVPAAGAGVIDGSSELLRPNGDVAPVMEDPPSNSDCSSSEDLSYVIAKKQTETCFPSRTSYSQIRCCRSCQGGTGCRDDAPASSAHFWWATGISVISNKAKGEEELETVVQSLSTAVNGLSNGGNSATRMPGC